jgi:anthranilate phosphoribosyltransferase
MDVVQALQKVVHHRHLTRDEATAVMDAIMSGQATHAQIAGLLTALRMKGETVDELVGFASVMRDKVLLVKTRADRGVLVDTCGTGGDATGTFNVSTATAFVVAGSGLPVAKHGNRSVSSRCGSADVVEALGVRLDLPPERVGECVDAVGIGFCYAPLLHHAMKHVMPARREMGIRTVFNLLGPLSNPARAAAQVIGVYDGALTEPMARVLLELGTVRAFVVHGEDGLDEITTTSESRIAEVRRGEVLTYKVKPEELGLPRATLSDLAGGTVAENAEIIRRVLAGDRGPKRDIVVLNAAAAIVAGGKAHDLRAGIAVAERSIDEGTAKAKLDRLVDFCSG